MQIKYFARVYSAASLIKNHSKQNVRSVIKILTDLKLQVTNE